MRIKYKLYGLLVSGLMSLGTYDGQYNRGDTIEIGWDFTLAFIRKFVDYLPYFIPALIILWFVLYIMRR